MNEYDINDKSFSPQDIWKVIMPEVLNSPDYELVKLTRDQVDKIVCLNKDIHDILNDPSRKPIVEHYRQLISVGDLIGMPIIAKLSSNGGRYIWCDGIHRTVVYFDMFDADTIPMILLGEKDIDAAVQL